MFSSKVLNKLTVNLYKNNLRFLSQSVTLLYPKTYEGDGKTSVNILNNEPETGVLINGISQIGFRLNNDITVLGPMVIFPRTVLSWKVNHVREITMESLSLFTILEPKLEILVIGTGDKLEDNSFYNTLIPFIQKFRINIELLPTEQAAATFNFLNCEGRYVAGALIPPNILKTTDDDMIQSKLRYQNLYEIE